MSPMLEPLRRHGLLDGPPRTRAAAARRAAGQDGPAGLALLRRAWALGLRDHATWRRLLGEVRDGRDLAALAGGLRDRAIAAALAEEADALLVAALDFQGLAMLHDLPPWEGWLAPALRRVLPPAPLPPPLPGPPVVAHVVPFPLEPDSPLPALPLEVAALHATLPARVFIPAPRALVAARNPALLELAARLGLAPTFTAADPAAPAPLRLRAWREEIAALGAACACFHYATHEMGLLAALRPAPLVVGFDHGHPGRFAAPVLDLCFATHPHGAMEGACPTLFLPLGLTRAHEGTPGALPRAALGLPDGAPLLMTSGSADKLRAPALARVLAAAMRAAPGLHVLALGDDALPPPGPGLAGRWHPRARRRDFAAVVALCDLYLDTVPTGGGFALAEAMRQRKPCAAAHHDLSGAFDRGRGFGAFCYLAPDPAIAVPPGDEAALAARVAEILADPAPQLARQAGLLPLITDPAAQVARMEEEVWRRLA
ncbi:hypothetical protein ACI6QG_18170 [Roseococcus sp. DSY-14]|uniref:hypothetical protein n=1 Tax=Roseococcus sp. DSY-14 TaxID=3369650 RepID=UPI00387B529D